MASSRDPQPLPSLPPSPTLTEQDLGGERLQDDEDATTPTTAAAKGKRRQVDDQQYDSVERDDSVDGSYPPTNDEEEDTRRVQENLKRWEIAERQRRKAAREVSGASVDRTGSIVGKLWTARNTADGPATHKALESRDSVEAVPLEDMPHSPTLSPNPFADPHQPDALMSPSNGPLDTPHGEHPPERPVLVASSSSFSKPPPPKPLGLPQPKSPPPPAIDTPPSPSPPPAVAPPTHSDDNDDTDGQEHRWWHDWLCGCTEGPDRGGENQAGRTNPNE